MVKTKVTKNMDEKTKKYLSEKVLKQMQPQEQDKYVWIPKYDDTYIFKESVLNTIDELKELNFNNTELIYL